MAIPYDPDFDGPYVKSEDEGRLQPKIIFWAGAVAGLLLFCTAGFFILLRAYFRG